MNGQNSGRPRCARCCCDFTRTSTLDKLHALCMYPPPPLCATGLFFRGVRHWSTPRKNSPDARGARLGYMRGACRATCTGGALQCIYTYIYSPVAARARSPRLRFCQTEFPGCMLKDVVVAHQSNQGCVRARGDSDGLVTLSSRSVIDWRALNDIRRAQ